MKGSSIDFLGKLISNLVALDGKKEVHWKWVPWTSQHKGLKLTSGVHTWNFDVWKNDMSFWDDSCSDAMTISQMFFELKINGLFFFTLRNQDSKHGNPEQIHIASCCQQNVKEIYDIVSYENKSFCCKSHHYSKGVPNNSQNFPNLPQVSPPEALRDRHSSRPNRLANLQYPSDDQILQTIGKQNDPHEMIWNHETSSSAEFETFVILHPGRRKKNLRPDLSPWPSRPSINPWAKIMVKRITFARQRQTAWSIEKNSSSTINGGPAINELARL